MKRIITMLVFFIFLTNLCACSNKTEPLTWQEQYDLGIRYLNEGNYEDAIIAFSAAIEIDPKRAPAYVGSGDAYVGYAQSFVADTPEGTSLNDEALEAYENAIKDYLAAIDLDNTVATVYQKVAAVYVILDNIESATEILERGLQSTDDQSLQTTLDEITGVVVPEELTEGSEKWTSLETFLAQLSWYHDYDYKTVATQTAANEWVQPQNALEKMLTVGTCYCYNDTLYPGEARDEVWFRSDPLGKWDSYMKVNADKQEWVLRHIFNCSQADIETMKKPILAGEDEFIYYLDGYYYFFIGGIGGGFDASITRIEQRGIRYYVEYALYDMYADAPEPYCAMVSLKEIDSEEYWSIYYCRRLGNIENENPGLISQETILQDNSVEHIVDMILDYESLWNGPFAPDTKYDYFSDNGPYSISFLDLDFDGLHELVVESPIMGSGLYTNRYIYQVRSNRLVEIENPYGLSTGWDEISLMQDHQTKDYFYVGYDCVRDGAYWYTETWEKFQIEQGTIQSSLLYVHNQEEDMATYYDSGYNAISKDKFDSVQRESLNSADMIGGYRGAEILDWDTTITREDKRNLLLDVYRATPYFLQGKLCYN